MNTERQMKIVLNRFEAHAALGLAADVQVVGFDHGNDPAYITVVVESERFEPVGSAWERPIVPLGQVRGSA